MRFMLSSSLNALGQGLSGDAFDWRFTGGINVENAKSVRIVKCVDEFIHKRLRASITMRLEYNVNLAKTALPRRRQRCPNLGRMMPVIVNHANSVSCAAQLETTIHSIKAFKSCTDLVDA